MSHPNVVTLNQAVYLKLVDRGWDVTGVLPANWKDAYQPDGFRPDVMPGLEGRMRHVRVALPGRPQRHFYLARVAKIVQEVSPDLAFMEQEFFSLPGLQWGVALRRAGVPFGLQADENLDRPFPWLARAIRSWLLPRTYWIAARSPTAEAMARRWGATGKIAITPHTVPEFAPVARSGDPVFTVGFAGRLVEEKGVRDLVAAVRRLPGPIRLLLVGDGPLRGELQRTSLANGVIELRPGVVNEDMRDRAYAEMDVLVLPSRTTKTWAEQYGKVLVEAMLCGRPVVGSDSGEIAWVIESAGGGLVYPEGDSDALAKRLERLRASPELRDQLARAGEKGARERFGIEACADALEELLLS